MASSGSTLSGETGSSSKFSIEANGNVVTIRVTSNGMVSEREWTSSGESSPTPDSGTSSDLDNHSPQLLSSKTDDEAFDSLTDYSSESDSKSSYYNFHLSENRTEESEVKEEEDDSFAGRKYIDSEEGGCRTIRSSKGTIRGVKNRVRAGIATFLHINANKSWCEKETGKVVVYTTTMGIVRGTAARCHKVRHILKTHLIKFTEKDSFMNREVQNEIRERTGWISINLPLVFVDGHYLGDADTIEKLNETGELRKILKPFKCPDSWSTCKVCGGYRVLPCGVCNGSKKSVHRNHFTTELVALKCMNCDEVGLVKCFNC